MVYIERLVYVIWDFVYSSVWYMVYLVYRSLAPTRPKYQQMGYVGCPYSVLARYPLSGKPVADDVGLLGFPGTRALTVEIPLIRVIWSLLGDIWDIFEASWRLLVYAQKRSWQFLGASKEEGFEIPTRRRGSPLGREVLDPLGRFLDYLGMSHLFFFGVAFRYREEVSEQKDGRKKPIKELSWEVQAQCQNLLAITQI